MEPGPVIVRIKLRYDTIDLFVEKYAVNVGRTAVFLPTKSTRDVGHEVRFELRIANDKPALVGVGKVLAVRPFDPQKPSVTFGMVVELTRITKESRSIVQRMLDIRKLRGLQDSALPIPVSADAAQRPVVESTGVVETPLPGQDSGANQAMFDQVPIAAPVAIIKPRPAMAGVLQAAASLAATTDRFFSNEENELMQMQVDLPSTMAMARKLMSATALDADLQALQEAAAAPVAVDVDEASAQLAQVLGGVAVRRNSRSAERSAGWATPPRVIGANVDVARPEANAASTPAPTLVATIAAAVTAPPAATSQRESTQAVAAAPTREPTLIDENLAATTREPTLIDEALADAPTREPTLIDEALADTPTREPAEVEESRPHPSTTFDAEPTPIPEPMEFARRPTRVIAEEPTQIGSMIPQRPPAPVLISDDMDLHSLAENTDFATLAAATPDVASTVPADEDEIIDGSELEIEAEAADEWGQQQSTVMAPNDALTAERIYPDPPIAMPAPGPDDFDFSDDTRQLRKRPASSTPPGKRNFAHTLPASARTNRHVTTRNPSFEKPGTTPPWHGNEVDNFEFETPVTVLAPGLSARLSSLDIDANDEVSDFGPIEPPTSSELRPMQSVASPSLDEALLSMGEDDDDDAEFFFEPPHQLPNEFSLDSPSITTAGALPTADDEIPIDIDFEILSEFDDEDGDGGTHGS